MAHGAETDDHDDVRAHALGVARIVLAVLRGQEPPPWTSLRTRDGGGDPHDGDADELAAEAAAGDIRAAAALRARAHLAALPERLRRALALERCQVTLADGSALPLDDAERLLAQKELGAPHAALRGLVDDACAHFQQFHAYGSVGRSNHPAAALPRRVLEQVLAATVGLRDAGLEALGALAGTPLGGGGRAGVALARALDLPDDTGGFGAVFTLALLRAAREAAAPAHAVARFASPRQLAGVVLEDSDAVRFAQPPMFERWRRHQLTVRAGAEALVRARDTDVQDVGHAAAVPLGVAFALGLLGASARRRLGASRSDAERAARIAACALIFDVRARAALALAADLDEAPTDRDRLGVAREALSKAWGAEPTTATAAELLVPSWTCVESFRDVAASEALAQLEATHMALALRDRFDEGYALRAESWSPDVWTELIGSQASASEGPNGEGPNGGGPNDDTRIRARTAALAGALTEWAGALL